MAYDPNLIAEQLRARQGYGHLVNTINREIINQGPTGIGQFEGHVIRVGATAAGGIGGGLIAYGAAGAWLGPAGVICGIVAGGVIAYFAADYMIETNRENANATRRSMEGVITRSFQVLNTYEEQRRRPVVLINELRDDLLREGYLIRCDADVIEFNNEKLNTIASWYVAEANVVNNVKFTILTAVAQFPPEDRPDNLVATFNPIVDQLSAAQQNAAHVTLGKLQLDRGRFPQSLQEFRAVTQDSDLFPVAGQMIHLIQQHYDERIR